MRCLGCNQQLTDYEMSFRFGGESLQLCMDCVDVIEEVSGKFEADMSLASEADMPLSSGDAHNQWKS